MRRLGLPCRDCHGAEALPPVQPLSGLICPEAVSSRTMGMFPGQSKFWSKKPPLADEREFGDD
jgi:hypothetical protein